MLAAEKLVNAGSTAVDISVETVVERCRAQRLATEVERAECVAPAEQLLDVTDPAIVAFTAALRGYWAARGAGDKAAVDQALVGLQEAVRSLPDSYFAGVKALLN